MVTNADLSSISFTMVARIAHEVNRAYCQSIGDQTQVKWDDAPDWQKQSAKDGVMFHFQNPEAGPSASHDNWLAGKTAEGWVWGPIKDADKKQHPCVMPFDELPPEQKVKDYLFRAVVHAAIID